MRPPRTKLCHTGMTLLLLSRVPSARAAVYCYATIVNHALSAKYPTAGAFLKKEHGATVASLAAAMGSHATTLPAAGWYELMRELAIQEVLGRLWDGAYVIRAAPFQLIQLIRLFDSCGVAPPCS